MLERTGRTIICSVVFVDIVGFSKTPDSQQLAMKERLNELIAKALGGVTESDRLILDTGDGAALCFLGDPEDALFAAAAVNDAIKSEPEHGINALRTGINLGPIKIVTDLNGRPNAIGDGINVAQRVMTFAGENEILVSRSFYEVVARLNEGNERLFHYLGIKKDKHVREHQLYAFGLVRCRAASVADDGADAARNTEIPAARPRGDDGGEDDDGGEGLVGASALSESDLAEVERRLTDRIGPLARILVRRAADGVADLGALYRAVATAIPDEAERVDFLAGAPAAARELPAAIDRHGAEDAGDPAEAAPRIAVSISEAQLASAERALTQHIGPFAAVLIKRAVPAATDLRDLYERLAAHIPDDAERRRFLTAANADR